MRKHKQKHMTENLLNYIPILMLNSKRLSTFSLLKIEQNDFKCRK